MRAALAPAHCALLVVDMQHDFCDPEGKLQRVYGRDSSAARDILPRITRLGSAAREARIPVLYTQMTRDPATESEAFAARRLMSHTRVGLCDRGSAGAAFWGVNPSEPDVVIEKHRPSAFHGTDLDLRLRSLGRKALIITGVATNVCVETTARDACSYDYWTVVISDATASYSPAEHAAALYNVENYFGWVLDTAQVLDVWRSAGAGDR